MQGGPGVSPQASRIFPSGVRMRVNTFCVGGEGKIRLVTVARFSCRYPKSGSPIRCEMSCDNLQFSRDCGLTTTAIDCLVTELRKLWGANNSIATCHFP